MCTKINSSENRWASWVKPSRLFTRPQMTCHELVVSKNEHLHQDVCTVLCIECWRKVLFVRERIALLSIGRSGPGPILRLGKVMLIQNKVWMRGIQYVFDMKEEFLTSRSLLLISFEVNLDDHLVHVNTQSKIFKVNPKPQGANKCKSIHNNIQFSALCSSKMFLLDKYTKGIIQ